jgi:hypothetical protein
MRLSWGTWGYEPHRLWAFGDVVRVATPLSSRGELFGPITKGNSGGADGQRGWLRILLGLSATLALVYACREFIPVYGPDYLLKNAPWNEAQFARPNLKLKDQFRRELAQKLKGPDITAAPEDIHFRWFDGGMRIWVD